MDEKKRIINENPYNKSSLISKIFLCWITPLVTVGLQKPLQEEDLYEPRHAEESEYLTEKLKLEWKKECSKKNPSLMKALIRLMYRKFLKASILVWFAETSILVQPLIISRIIKYFSGEITLQWTIIYSILLSFLIFIKFVSSHRYFFLVDLYGLQMRIAVSGLIYEKTLKINTKMVENSNSKSKNINTIQLLSNDVSKIHNGSYFLPYLVFGPYQAIGILIILIQLVDYSILSGLMLFVFVLPLQSLLGKILNYLKTKVAKITDERINLISEILNGIKIIKMNCWEAPFKTLIERIRKKELKHQAAIYSISALNGFIDLDFSNVMIFVSVTVFFHITNAPLVPAYLVYIMSYSNRMCAALGFFFMYALTELISARVGIKRIQSYLLMDEVQNRVPNNRSGDKSYVRVERLTSKWSNDDDTFSLRKISFNITEGELMAITGSTGAGKTSLLLSLIGEVPYREGNVQLNGSVFYVSQEPWLFTATVKQNIIFGRTYNEQKFKEIVKVCQLSDDLKQFPNAELTLIGEKGINLSGGQRARVSLARALYADPDIYLLDDPLSAVDASVAKLLFDKCINGYLKNKIRILVTHQVHYLENVNKVLTLMNGEVGSGHETLTITEKNNVKERVSSETDKLIKSNLSLAPNEKTEKEETQYDESYNEKHTTGSIKWNIYKYFFKTKLVFFSQVFILLVFIAAQGCQLACGYFLSNWANNEEINVKLKANNHETQFNTSISYDFRNLTYSTSKMTMTNVYPQREKYYNIYLMLSILALLLAATKSVLFYIMCLYNSKSIHKTMLSKVLVAKMRFFDLNPLGRIVNRFSKDVSNLDEQLPVTLYDFLQCSMICLGAIFMACFINFAILFLLIPVLVVFLYFRRRFIISSRELKRLEGISRSPIFVHASNTLTGITTIRAANKQELLQKEFYMHLNGFTQAYFALCSLNRWFGIRLDLVLLVYTLILVYSCIMLKDFLGINSGLVGLLLIHNIQLSALFQWTVRQSAEVENLMTSVERIIEYSNIENEEKNIDPKKPEDWPKTGSIEFRDVSYAYDKNLPNVLKNLSLSIESGEKVGIIGRTGAGKSSFFQCLLRMGEQNGSILIDGVDTKELSLKDVRSKIALIPQEPTLFIGTIRSNIDPFNENTDINIWRALENVNLKEYVESLKGGLEARVEKGGSNLSVGQKQLFCLARAILRNAKILIVDEATANVDFETDALVQKAIRELFKNQTVLTIAHRLHTVIDNDRIICLSNGNLVNFDTPHNLLMDKSSILSELVSKLSEKETKALYELAFMNT